MEIEHYLIWQQIISQHATTNHSLSLSFMQLFCEDMVREAHALLGYYCHLLQTQNTGSTAG